MEQAESSYWQKIKHFFAVLVPIFIAQTAIVSVGFFDSVMAGHVSEQDLAGVAVGVNIFMPFYIACLATISGLTPRIAQLYGGQQHAEIRAVVQQGFYWSLMLAVILLLAGIVAVPLILPYLQLEPYVETVVVRFLLAIAFGVPPIMAASVLRNLMDALGQTRLTMLITIITVPIIICCNYVFIYGVGPFPQCGGAGAGVGTAIAYYVNLGLSILLVKKVKLFQRYKVFSQLPKPNWQEWKQQLALGLPIGSTVFCEQSIFDAVGLLMTAYGTEVLAAHQATMSFNNVVYMIPFSISMALTIVVGYELGAKRPEAAKEYARLGRGLSILFAWSLAVVIYHIRPFIASLYSDEPGLSELIVAFLGYAIMLQSVDGINAPLQGILRGYKDVTTAFLLAIFSFWVVGLPGGWLYAHFGFGPYGYWLGLISGIFSGAILLEIRLRIVQKRQAKNFLQKK